MRHRVYGKHLGRTKNERTALFRGLVQALLIHGSIVTTEPKAKAIKGLVDKVINQAKSKNTQRLLSFFLLDNQIKEKLVKDIAPILKERTSGYTSLVKMGPRKGDNAMLVKMSLIGYEEKKEEKKVASKKEPTKQAKSKVAVKKGSSK